jgi:hypothetical protein
VTAVELAALADDVRGDVPSLDSMLPVDRADDRELLALSAAYVDRASRIAWGVVLFTPVAITLVLLAVQAITLWLPHEPQQLFWRYIEWDSESSSWLLDLDDYAQMSFTICVAAIVAGFVRRYAAARFARSVAGPEPLAVAHAMLARIQPWFVACWTIGLVVFCGFFATVHAFQVSSLVFEFSRGDFFSWGNPSSSLLSWAADQHFDATSRIRELWILTPTVVIGAIWVARRAPFWLRVRYVGWAGSAVALLALAGAFAVCDYDLHHHTIVAHSILRTAIVVVGGIGLFATVSSFAVRRGDGRE